MKKLVIVIMLLILATSIPAEAGIFSFISHIGNNIAKNKRHRQFKQRKRENLKKQHAIQTYKTNRHGSKRF